jgi:MSHA biogenesis protein MshL
VNIKQFLCAVWLCLALAHPAFTVDAATAARFDIEVVDAPARAFFLGLAKRGGDNVLVHQQVAGSVTLSLHNVTVAETLDAVRELYGYDYRRLTAGYFVLPAALQMRFFQVNYLDMARQGQSRTLVSSGSITDARHDAGAGGSSGGNTSNAAVGGGAPASGTVTTELTGTSIVSRTDADFWAQLEASLKAVVGGGPERSVVINRLSGMVAVRASPDELRGVEQYLGRIQQTVSRQVILEAKIIEVELNDAFQAGINWGAVLRNGSQTFFGGLSTPPSGFDNPLLSNTGAPVTVGPGNPVTSLATQSLGGAFTLAVDLHDVGAFLDLLKTQGNARVLSSPRVTTMHNQKAVIKAGTDEFFVTGVTSNTTTGTATTTSRDVELTPFFSGIALDVTPQIDAEDHVILHIHPSVSEVRDQTKRITVGGQTDELPLAVSEVRESDSVVKAHSGQMIIIGGLMRSLTKRQSYGTPGLSAVPVLGNLFKSKRNVETKTELVILLRPVIVNDGNAESLAAEATARVGVDSASAVRR